MSVTTQSNISKRQKSWLKVHDEKFFKKYFFLQLFETTPSLYKCKGQNKDLKRKKHKKEMEDFKMKKRIITTLLVAVLGLSSGITAFAAPKTMPDGNVFDAEYYASTYADVKEALGTDEVMLYKHYLDYGKKEGRKPTADNEQSLNQGSTEVSNSSGLTFEESDRNYLIAATIANGGEHVEGEWWSSTYNFVRKDYTADPRYQELKAWII